MLAACRAFKGRGRPSADDFAAISTQGYGVSALGALKRLGWKGQTAGFVVLALSNDDLAVDSRRFELAGAVEDLRARAATIWEGAPAGATLCLTIPDCGIFEFSNDGPWSEPPEPRGRSGNWTMDLAT